MNKETQVPTQSTTAPVLDADLSAVAPVKVATTKQKKRHYNRRSAIEKRFLLNEIVEKLGKHVITRKELKTCEDENNPWNSFAFIFNAKECYAGRGVYDLTKIKGLNFTPKA